MNLVETKAEAREIERVDPRADKFRSLLYHAGEVVTPGCALARHIAIVLDHIPARPCAPLGETNEAFIVELATRVLMGMED